MKRIGVHDIARLAKVSIGTVDRALHGRSGISEATRAKVLRIAANAGYSPDLAARSLAIRRSQYRIGVCVPEEIRFFYDQMRAGIVDEARRVNSLGIELVYEPVPALGEREKERLTALLKQDIQGLIVVPGNPRAVAPIINEAERNNTRVVCVSSDAPHSHRSTVVCVNPELNGHLAAELMSKFIPQGGEVAIITGMLKTEDHRQKTAGFRAGFEKHARGSIVAVVEAHESESESFQKTSELLRKHPELAGLYVTTVNCLPVCHAIRECNAHNLRLITTDLFKEMVPYIEQGIIGASVYQDPYTQGRNAVRLLVDHLVEKTPFAPANYLNPGIVLQTNLSLFRETQA